VLGCCGAKGTGSNGAAILKDYSSRCREDHVSQLSQLLTGLILLVASAVAILILLPRHGRTAWVAHQPLLAPAMSVLIIGGLAIGLILIAAYFTTIDNMTLRG
jgi:hypothetical protein